MAKNAAEFLGFLAQLASEYRGQHCVLLLDNASRHTAKVIQRLLDELTGLFRGVRLPRY